MKKITHIIRSFFSLLILGWAPLSSAQVEINAATNCTPAQIDAVHLTGSGISGPGKPVEGDGVLGIVSGTPLTQENRARMASGKTVAEGLIPHIKPIWDVHMRDTDIILGGDGNYYMTGSSGDNIWKYNDGIELWKSSDLIHWKYLGLVWSLEKDGGWEKNGVIIVGPFVPSGLLRSVISIRIIISLLECLPVGCRSSRARQASLKVPMFTQPIRTGRWSAESGRRRIPS